MKRGPKKIINSQSQSESICVISSQETNNSNYKTSKKKHLSKVKGSGSGSTQYTDSSQYKRSAKINKIQDLNKKIIFDDYNPSQTLDLGRINMDPYSQESNIPTQLRINDTQSQNFGYCYSQLEDDRQHVNQIQDDHEYRGDYPYQMKQYDENSNNFQYPYSFNFQSINIHQQQMYSNLMRSNSFAQSNQEQQIVLNRQPSSREMIAENVNPINSHRNQTEPGYINSARSRNVSSNQIERREEVQYYNENDAYKQQQQVLNSNRNISERRLLGDITDQVKPLQSPELEVEFQFNNTNNNKHINNIDQEADDENSNHNMQQNQGMENEYQGNLFCPSDDINFIDDNQYWNNYQCDQSLGLHPPLDDQNNQFAFFPSNQNSQQFPLQQEQDVEKKQSMEEMLANFKQDDVFAFDEQDLQEIEERQNYYYINPDTLLSYNCMFTNFPKKRAVLIDWLQEVSVGFFFKRETFQQAISILDRYFEKYPQIPKNEIQLVGVVALVIAHKIEEVNCKKNEEFLSICNGTYSENQLIQMEIQICLKLKFELNPPTPYFWMNQLMLQWDGLAEQYQELFEDEIISFKKNDHRAFHQFSSVCQYIDCSFYNLHIYYYSIQKVIALFMYQTLYTNIQKQNDNETKVYYLKSLFEHFIKTTFGQDSFDELRKVKQFTDQFQELQISNKLPETLRYTHRSDSKGYESFEHICSQQIYNKDIKKIFKLSC